MFVKVFNKSNWFLIESDSWTGKEGGAQKREEGKQIS